MIQRATTLHGVEIAYETFGRASHPPMLLIMGLGIQMLGWPDGFCEDLAGRGHFVVRFDNRDVGLSTHLQEAHGRIRWPPGQGTSPRVRTAVGHGRRHSRL